ncbi:MAG: lytic transglycosylase domain-containing protein [Dechloromonas sp.]|nr:lytic transglycosylase domain-containing protein [Dechloromonas sp.]
MLRTAAIAGPRQLPRLRAGRRAVLALASLALVHTAAADIYLRDEGADGIALTNLPGHQAQLVMAESRPVRPDPKALPAPRRGPPVSPATRQHLASLVTAAAATHGLPEELLTAVIEVESNFNPGAISPKGAIGLMQLMPKTARHLAVADASDPAANIDGGARYLKELLGSFGNNLHLALAAYNAGPGTVRRTGSIPPYSETQRYVPQVITRYHRLQSGLVAGR